MDSEGDKYAAGSPSGLGSQDPYGYSYTAPNPFSGLNQINPNAVSPMFGVAGVPSIASGPEYLQYDIRGRGGIERTFFNCGTMYLIGISTGGAIGFMEGLRSSPSSKFKIRLNTVLNKCGRRGSRFGNALGSLAMLYSIFESISEKAEADRYLGGYEIVNPVLASIATGLVYKSTHGPKTMLLAGLLGGTFVLGVTGVKQLLPRPYNAPSGLLFF